MERSIYFARQELNESDGAAEVTEMFDGYEQKTYKYTYDEFNNPTGYRREKNNNDFFELKKIGPTKIEYTNLNSRILAKESLMYTVGLGISCIAAGRSASTQTFILIIKRTDTLSLKNGQIYGDKKIIGGIKIWNM